MPLDSSLETYVVAHTPQLQGVSYVHAESCTELRAQTGSMDEIAVLGAFDDCISAVTRARVARQPVVPCPKCCPEASD